VRSGTLASVAAIIIIGAFVAFIAFVMSKAASNAQGANTIDRLRQGGVPGRGLVLASSVISTGVTVGMRRFEQRQMTIEVEVYGQQPYVIQGTFMVPRGLVDAIPGSSLELAVDSGNPNQIAILGPGGFTGPWLQVGPPQAY
jgi:hypothetical protein